MRRCPDCTVEVEGEWARCPLCGTTLVGEPVPGPYPTVPLRFSRRRVLRVLFLTSLAVIVLSFLAQLLFGRDQDGIGALRSVWLGIVTTWLVVVMAVSKRRNLAKFIVYLVVLAGGVCVYWDYLSGWSGWSLTFVVPIVCAASIVGLLITARVVRIEVGDYVVYSGLTVLLGAHPDPLPGAGMGGHGDPLGDLRGPQRRRGGAAADGAGRDRAPRARQAAAPVSDSAR